MSAGRERLMCGQYRDRAAGSGAGRVRGGPNLSNPEIS